MGRITLSMFETTTPPNTLSPIACPKCPVAKSTIAPGTQTSADPTSGSTDAMAVTVPQTMEFGNPSTANARPTSRPWAIATTTTPSTVAIVTS